MNIFGVIYQGLVLPSRVRFENSFELFNEFMIQLTTLTIILFTPWVGEPSIEYNYGWITISFMILTAFVNMSHVLYHLIMNLVLIYKKLKNKALYTYQTYKDKK